MSGVLVVDGEDEGNAETTNVRRLVMATSAVEVAEKEGGTELAVSADDDQATLEKKNIVFTGIYPSPLAPHQELVRNSSLFTVALRRFHHAMGTKFMVPVIGGKDLDLHLLYVQVTNRGGLEKVILERRWREVIAVFNFPATTTSASFVLRKYYLSLLYHFEQVHFFGAKGPLLAPSEALQTKTPISKLESTPEYVMASKEKDRKRSLSESTTPPCNGYAELHDQRGAAEAPYNFSVSGTIDGKFDLGYFVTVKIGEQILKGVLYHTVNLSTSSCSSIQKGHENVVHDQGRTYRRRKRYRFRDPAHPKPNRSAYNFFFKEKHSKLKVEYPQREREFSKMIGESWSKLTEEERMVYQDIGRKDRERYKKEMQEYREKLKIGAIGPSASSATVEAMKDGEEDDHLPYLGSCRE